MKKRYKHKCKCCGEMKSLKGGYCGKLSCLKVKGEASRPNKDAELPDSFDRQNNSYFYSLVTPKEEQKLRKCLRCLVPFKTTRAQRICSKCSGRMTNSRMG